VAGVELVIPAAGHAFVEVLPVCGWDVRVVIALEGEHGRLDLRQQGAEHWEIGAVAADVSARLGEAITLVEGEVVLARLGRELVLLDQL
jgi:hypothetical protein